MVIELMFFYISQSKKNLRLGGFPQHTEGRILISPLNVEVQPGHNVP